MRPLLRQFRNSPRCISTGRRRRLLVSTASLLSMLSLGLSLPVAAYAQSSPAISADAMQAGSVSSRIVDTDGKPVANASVSVVGTSLAALTDSSGRFTLSDVPVGTQTLEINSPELVPMEVTDVVIRPGTKKILGQIDGYTRKNGVVQLSKYTVNGQKLDEITHMDRYVVTGERPTPFSDRNVDLPRTENDAQAYYIFDAKMIDQSGVSSVEEFLRQRLSMNYVKQTYAANSPDNINTSGATSQVNLRGLGTDKTLILINGRRTAGVNFGAYNLSGQPDLNGIPLGSIDRIEVLPTSGSGIYGASALGGVINVILKKDYSGGELRVEYKNAFDTDAPSKLVSLSYGIPLEGGKTNLTVNAQYSKMQPMMVRDRDNLYQHQVATLLHNVPDYYSNVKYVYTTRVLPDGSTPNIMSLNGTPLTFKDGTSLGSVVTYIPVGTSPTTTAAALRAGLIQNAGKLNNEPSYTYTLPFGKLTNFTSPSEVKSFSATVRRQMTASVEAYAEFSSNSNSSTYQYNPIPKRMVVPVDRPNNPFNAGVFISFPTPVAAPFTTDAKTLVVSAGLQAKLPHDWISNLDFTWSRNDLKSNYSIGTADAFYYDSLSGLINPFVDTIKYGGYLGDYFNTHVSNYRTEQKSISLRAAGPAWALPWGTPTLSVLMEYNENGIPLGYDRGYNPRDPGHGDHSLVLLSTSDYFPMKQRVASVAVEALIPLVRKNALKYLHSLQLQLAGRGDSYSNDTGTSSFGRLYYDPIYEYYDGPTINGLPYKAKVTYSSVNPVLGLTYQPVQDLTVRTSYSTGFVPPTPTQLRKDPTPGDYPTTINDPVTGGMYDVLTISGGNPDIKPENSKTISGGLVWQPTTNPWLNGFRFSADWLQITQHDKIGNLSADAILRDPALASRVTRDPATKLVTLIDTSLFNLTLFETQAWDYTAEYRRVTPWGTFDVAANWTHTFYEKRQSSLGGAMVDYAGLSSGPLKNNGSVRLTWERRRWTAGWATQVIGKYTASGAGADYSSPLNVAAQGGRIIPTQYIHDAFVTYRTGKVATSSGYWNRVKAVLLDDLTIQVAVKNVFNTFPEFDFSGAYYSSPYVDNHLRTYQISLRKQF